MKASDPLILKERWTLGSLESPEAHLLLDSGLATFVNGMWKGGAVDLHVFDGAFVTANVHAGDDVSTDQRRSMYRVIVGEKGVQLAEEVDALDANVAESTGRIALERKGLQPYVPTALTLDTFLALAEDSNVDTKIAEQQAKIAAASQAAQIATKPQLSISPVPSVPSALLPALQKTIQGLSKDTTDAVSAHLTKHEWGRGGEQWLAEGVVHIQNHQCPFCAASVKDNSLVEIFGQHFDKSYKDLKVELAMLRQAVLTSLSDAEGLRMRGRFELLDKDASYWKAFGKVDFVSVPDLDGAQAKLAALHTEAIAALDAKLAAPLEIGDLNAVQDAIAEWELASAGLHACNDSVAAANASIQAIKATVAAVDKSKLEATLRDLEAVKRRHSPEVVAAAANYYAAITVKDGFVVAKDKKKGELDDYDAAMLPKYHEAINTYLTQFGAAFRLMKSEKTYQGKIPQWIYTIEVNKQPVDVTKKAGQGEASFQSVMSAGDRSTLALAFFLARLDLDPNLKDAVVVFDDPFTSLDEFRKAMTARSIFRVGQTASQVIVFSHDKYFLEAVADGVGGAKCETFQISSTKTNSCIEAWDLKREVKDGYLRAHMDMLDFHNGKSGTAGEMRLKMRPLLESYIRYRFPNQIPDGLWLGDMLAKIRADPNHPLTSVYQEIDDVNNFTAPFHHDATAAFNEDEVKSYVNRTLDVIGGC